jgi:SanA protein
MHPRWLVENRREMPVQPTPVQASTPPPEDQGAVPGDVWPNEVQAQTDEPRHAPKRRIHTWLRYGIALAIGALLALAFGLALVDMGITLSTRHSITHSIDEVKPAPVALLLGTARTHRGKPNRFYQARIEAAAALFHQGRVRGILVSGDNATRHYNEPIVMQKDLMALGVPAEFITLDYAGFRTLDSIVRAKEVFGLDEVLVVSQGFHAARAIFLARQFGIDAKGFAAADPPRSGFLKVRTREVLARAAAILDVLTGQGPRFLGKPETVRLRDGQPEVKG